ncbi:MAG: ORF6N domain-containing protein [Bacteroidetes bacterium]|nr:ORF6N domain-containing protein [Bacteroidota bacterium]
MLTNHDAKFVQFILNIRGVQVMLDTDLAAIYGVSTKRLNEQVKRNRNRFPEDFMFQLTRVEKDEVVANCDHLEKLKYSNTTPFAFTEYGVLMLANVVSSETAIKTSVHVVRAFVRLRELAMQNSLLSKRMEELEDRIDSQFQEIFLILSNLMSLQNNPEERPRIGFTSN